MLLKVKVIPKAHASGIAGWEGEILKIRLKAVPEKGEANLELIVYLAKFLDITKSQVELISGQTSRRKTVKIHGLTEEALKNKLNMI